ncbi:hypothetical protein FOZ60_015942 [Perkinsus olseni]|uniref:Uncharacterized protein n=1 Tax=Perkinsus olseni TaxID=32597 RepID=A0A7J6N5B0_PEROL|nr:hypothetical protein FOZ60_015942 [Perkinsus olseni]
MDYTLSYLLAIRCYNSTPRHWSTISPSALHYAYRQWLPTDPPTNFPSVDWGKLEIEYLNFDYLTYVQSLLSALSDLREKTKASVQVYIDSWRSKQADLRERSIKETPQDYRLSLYDLVCTTEVANSIGGYQNSNWRGSLTVVRLAGTSMVYLFDGTERLPNDRTTMAVTYKFRVIGTLFKVVPLMEVSSTPRSRTWFRPKLCRTWSMITSRTVFESIKMLSVACLQCRTMPTAQISPRFFFDKLKIRSPRPEVIDATSLCLVVKTPL